MATRPSASMPTTRSPRCASRSRRRERERLAALAVDAAGALERTLRAWRPGERDLDLQARIAGELERRGAFGACLIVGGDERVERFRHPLAIGAPVTRLAMAVVVAERGGLHAAATRIACSDGLPEHVRARLAGRARRRGAHARRDATGRRPTAMS